MRRLARAHEAGSGASKQVLFGLSEWFRPGEVQRVEAVVEDLRELSLRHLRIGISWASWADPAGREWYEWLVGRLEGEAELLPSLAPCCPPETGGENFDPEAYDEFVWGVCERLGSSFTWVELPAEGCGVTDGAASGCAVALAAARRARGLGKRCVLGMQAPEALPLLAELAAGKALGELDAVGLNLSPGSAAWSSVFAEARKLLDERRPGPELWVSSAGFSTWKNDEYGQLRAFAQLSALPACRSYWHAARDLPHELCCRSGAHRQDEPFHVGLKRADGKPKLLARAWAEEGLKGVRALAKLHEGSGANQGRKALETARAPGRFPRRERLALITGGAGFIGTNLAHRLLSRGVPVLIYDNLSRPGVEKNLRWLTSVHGGQVHVELGDVRNACLVRSAVARADQVFHLAAQVAVTTSLDDPLEDFDVNVRGTLNVLEAIRGRATPPTLLFTSTNKVYGSLADVALRETEGRYEPVGPAARSFGIGEERALDFHSPYGCSKGAADQYILDYARTYRLPAAVFRMSCIYGPHQFGTEDQGWVAHFLIQAARGAPITLYGDGKQVRDILFVEDLVDAFLLAQRNMPKIAGTPFNIGGGPANTTSLLELLDRIEELSGARPKVRWGGWRTGDQRYYVSDTRAFQRATGWLPAFSAARGVELLHRWLVEEAGLAQERRAPVPMAVAESAAARSQAFEAQAAAGTP